MTKYCWLAFQDNGYFWFLLPRHGTWLSTPICVWPPGLQFVFTVFSPQFLFTVSQPSACIWIVIIGNINKSKGCIYNATILDFYDLTVDRIKTKNILKIQLYKLYNNKYMMGFLYKHKVFFINTKSNSKC